MSALEAGINKHCGFRMNHLTAVVTIMGGRQEEYKHS